MSLWIAFGALLVITLSIVVLPLIRGKRGVMLDHNAMVYRDQLTEIDSDVERGLLSESEAKALKTEINRRIEKLPEVELSEKDSRKLQLSAAIAIMIVLPLAALGLYRHLGSPEKPDLPFAARTFAPPPKSAQIQANAEMARLVEALQKRMEQSPDKLDGWLLLGRSLVTLEHYADASNAFKRAFKLDPTRAEIAASIAETAFMAAGGKFDGEPRTFFTMAQKLNPKEHKALFYIGLDLANQKKFSEAIQIWVDLMAISPVGAPWFDTVRQRLVDAAEAGNLKIANFTPRFKVLETSAPGPTQEDIKAAGEMFGEDRQAFIRSMVERLAERLKSEPNDLNGWQRLARAYRVLGKTKKADDAERRIDELVKSQIK